MSNLIKPYQITVWNDVWDSVQGKFVEKRLGIIGADSMESQSRAIEPQFTRNVNGVKKLTFKMYAKYKDSVTGEDTKNPFIDWLISERKVKLFYENEWHDFVVKNIVENSNTYLYTYQLEDALVQELSKNGFGVVLDAQLMNNMGTANELAKRILEETDWTVSDESEAFVQTIEEPLVYVTIPSGTAAKHIKDQSDLKTGVSVEDYTFSTATTVLAFYSCCVNKPHRFQFLWTGNEEKKLDESDKRTIINKDCQYYIDIEDPSTYQEITFDEESAEGNKKDRGFRGYLPSGFSVAAVEEIDNSDVTVNLSILYRGRRYGFSQQSIFVPVLDKYVNIFDKDGKDYYGYLKADYHSPALTQNIVSNSQFDSTSGWVGACFKPENGEVNTDNKAVVESVFGRFEENEFINCIDELSNGTFDLEGASKNNKNYLKVTFKGSDSVLINSGPFDNRTMIGNMEKGDLWAYRSKWLSSTGEDVDCIITSLGEYEYNPNGAYVPPASVRIEFDAYDNSESGYILTSDAGTYNLFEVQSTDYNEKQFKKNTKVRLCFTSSAAGTYYLEEAELFKAAFTDDKKLIIPDKQADNLEDRVIEKTYKYFLPSAVENISSEEELRYTSSSKTLDYSTYKPKYNDGAQKVRAVSAKESNYFNILQSIAETFEAWLKLKITRDSYGGVIKKEVLFKNYVGKENFAGFKYGVNLKDIQRTYESKNIVTKLYVKQNNNQHGENGFCTIARANTNPSGETSIYDFKYFQDTGLMNSTDYLNTVDLYSYESIVGPDKVLFSSDDKILYTSKTEFAVPSDNIYEYADDIEVNVGAKQDKLGRNAQQLNTYKRESFTEEAARGYGEINHEEWWFTQDEDSETPYDNSHLKVGDIVYVLGKTSDTNREYAVYGEYLAYTSNYSDSNRAAIKVKTTQFVIDMDWYKIANKYTKYYCIKTGETWGPVMDFAYGNLQGYNPRLKMLNNKIQTANNELINIAKDLAKYSADLEVAEVGYDSATTAIEDAEATFQGLTGITFSETGTYKIKKIDLDEINKGWSSDDDTRKGYVVHTSFNWLSDNLTVSTTYDSTRTTATISLSGNLKEVEFNDDEEHSDAEKYPARELTVYAYPILTDSKDSTINRVVKINCSSEAGSTTISGSATVDILQSNRSDIAKCLKEYATLLKERKTHSDNKTVADNGYKTNKAAYDKLKATIDQYKIFKLLLNQRFFAQYSRFIQEGTWISEEYVDDEKYYLDSLSVLHNSCYPQVAYQINVLELSKLPGYELFTFELGDRTYVEDKEFFGNNYKEKVVITELSKNLDDPSKNQIKVQNFKNHFQDLFQKITATVQQTKYSTGAYEKAVALTESGQEERAQFVTSALDAATARLTAAGQQSVTWGNDGITVKSINSPSDQIRMVGGAILLSKQDENGQQKWVTGVTSDGVSADLVTAGTLHAGNVQIMSGDDPAFRWDENGINAFHKDTDGKYSPYKFVRFDRHGIYGISTTDNEDTYVPEDEKQVQDDATFSLTWEGLKVTGGSGAIAKIGKQVLELDGEDKEFIMVVKNAQNDDTFRIDNNGNVEVKGKIIAASGKIAGWEVDNNSLRAGELGKQDSMWLVRNGSVVSGTISGETRDGWCIGIADKFGVTKEGNLYASEGYFGIYDFTTPTLLTQSDNAYTYGDGTPILLPSNGAIEKLEDGGMRASFLTVDGSETYYRLVENNENNLYSLKKGINYRFSGKVRLAHWWHSDFGAFGGEDTPANNFENLSVRIEYKDSEKTGWTELVKEVVLTEATDGSYFNDFPPLSLPDDKWIPFSCNFTIPDNETVTGAYVSFQIYRKNSGHYGGYLYLKDLYLGEAYTPYHAAEIKPNQGLTFWSAPTNTNWYKEDNLVFRVNENGAYVKGEIKADKGDIGSWSIDSNCLKNGNFYLYGANSSIVGNSTITGTSKKVISSGRSVEGERETFVESVRKTYKGSFYYTAGTINITLDPGVDLSNGKYIESFRIVSQSFSLSGYQGYVFNTTPTLTKDNKISLEMSLDTVFSSKALFEYSIRIEYNIYKKETEPSIVETFSLLEDGTFYAEMGQIGPLSITKTSIGIKADNIPISTVITSEDIGARKGTFHRVRLGAINQNFTYLESDQLDEKYGEPRISYHLKDNVPGANFIVFTTTGIGLFYSHGQDDSTDSRMDYFSTWEELLKEVPQEENT